MLEGCLSARDSERREKIDLFLWLWPGHEVLLDQRDYIHHVYSPGLHSTFTTCSSEIPSDFRSLLSAIVSIKS